MTRPQSKLLAPIAAAMMLALGTGSAFAATNPSIYQNYMTGQSAQTGPSSDVFREGQIWATYVMNPALQSYRIDSDVHGDKATLTGTVDTKYEKLLAGAIAQQVRGIDTVDNQIKIDPAAIVVTTFVPANAYAQHVRNATTSAEINSQLLSNQYTDGLDIDVKTRDGKVTLTGVADTRKAKRRAGEIAGDTRGVTSVDNQLRVSGDAVANSSSATALINDDWIADNIRSSFMFTAGMDPGDIDVNVDNRSVTLSGTADSDMERQKAIEIAQQTLGVRSVDADGLRVTQDQVAMQ
jgi:osmotically-inducible protein OsmY